MIISCTKTTQELLSETIRFYTLRVRELEEELRTIVYRRTRNIAKGEPLDRAAHDRQEKVEELLQGSRWILDRTLYEIAYPGYSLGQPKGELGCTTLLVQEKDCEIVNGLRVAKEISFNKTVASSPEYGQYTVHTGGMVGCWFNHGTALEPRWSSNT